VTTKPTTTNGTSTTAKMIHGITRAAYLPSCPIPAACAVRAAVESDAAVRADEMCEARCLADLVAEATVERRADSLLALLWLEHPRLGEERRPVAHVLLMAAGELGDPLALFVLVEADDRPLHGLDLPAADRGYHVDAGVGGELGVELAAGPVDVDVDVRTQRRPSLHEPVAEAGPTLVEPVDRLAHGRGVDVELAREPRKERRQRRGEVQLGHQSTDAYVTDVMPGKSPPIWLQLSPSSVLANSCPVLVPK
jgi:hypothetical protein